MPKTIAKRGSGDSSTTRGLNPARIHNDASQPNFHPRDLSLGRGENLDPGLLLLGLLTGLPASVIPFTCEFLATSLPLDGFTSAVTSFQLRPVFGAVSGRVPPGDAMSCCAWFGDKSRDNFKNFFQTQGFEFLFLSQRARRATFGGSIAPKTPVLKLNRPLACKPPAAITSESARAAFASFAKPQVAGMRDRQAK